MKGVSQIIKISADSTCDLSPEIVEKLGISIVPLTIIAGEKEFKDGITISAADVVKNVEQEGTLCRTAAVNVNDYLEIFQKLLEENDAVIHINIGSGFSSCHQNAVLAAQQLENVYVVNSESLSTGSGYLVYEAALMAREGIEPQEICRRLEEMVPKVEISFVIDRLDYLQKGGRCSALAAQGARLLRIKPCIEVQEGKMVVGKKYRGSFEKALMQYVRDRLEGRNDIDYKRIFITHPMCSPETVEMVREQISNYADFAEILVTNAGATVTTHCGPNTLGIIFKRN